jgi:hypothetical protein
MHMHVYTCGHIYIHPYVYTYGHAFIYSQRAVEQAYAPYIEAFELLCDNGNALATR